MKTEPTYETVFQALVEIRKDIHEKTSLFDEQTRQAQLKCLEDAFQQQKDALAECLDGIDQQLITLSVYFEEYQNLRASLTNVNEKGIPELGGVPQGMPEVIESDNLMEILGRRIDYLKSEGKI